MHDLKDRALDLAVCADCFLSAPVLTTFERCFLGDPVIPQALLFETAAHQERSLAAMNEKGDGTVPASGERPPV